MTRLNLGTACESRVEILGKLFTVRGDEGYLAHVSERFEPETASLLSVLCDEDTQAIDVGANIGMTALALSQICSRGKIVALEPVPQTYEFLRANLSVAGVDNVSAFNFGAGSRDATFRMQGNPQDSSGAFVADQHTIQSDAYFAVSVTLKTIDHAFPDLGLDRLDFMKIDVEGYELEVLEGASKIVQMYRPTVLLEMNHWCLNTFRRTSLPEFRDRLLQIFPFVYAVQPPTFLDFREERHLHHIYYHHMLKMKFMNIVAGFDASEILTRLQTLPDTTAPSPELAVTELTKPDAYSVEGLADRESELAAVQASLNCAQAELTAVHSSLAETQNMLRQIVNSRSWKLTEPLRRVARALRGE